ncbi:MAG: 30S ribosomal protein S11 [bacterium]|nr:30S ribosomal protein S11 [bacterium]
MADEVQATTTEGAGADAKPAVKARVHVGKPKRQTPRGNAYVSASYNNTIVTMTDPKGDALAWSSAGSCGFRGPKKATPYAAGIVIRELMKKLEGTGLREVYVFVRGVGSGREAAVRALHAQGLHVSGIKDTTPIPHNGCRPPKPRRI